MTAFFKEFSFLLIELIVLFVFISFLVAILQQYFSDEKIKSILTSKHKVLNSVKGALIGLVTPFCSCSTIPLLIALFQAKAPFSGAISYLFASPLLNPIIVILFFNFFGGKATLIYVAFTFSWAVLVGLLFEKLGFENEVKIKPQKTCSCSCKTVQIAQDGFLQKSKKAFNNSFGIFKDVAPYFVLGAFLGAFIHEFVPTDLIQKITHKEDIWSVPIASVIGVPLYIRVSTILPVADILVHKGAALGTVVALIIGGAGISIPEITLLKGIFRRKIVIFFVFSVFLTAVITGYLFNFVL